MSIYEFIGKVPEFEQTVYSLLPSKNAALAGFFFFSVLMFVYCLLRKPVNPKYRPELLFPTLLYGCFFSYLYGIHDEVFINLQHPYNLFHHGFFSMAPDRMVDGTVEILFYLLHLPFAYNQKMLILGNYLISMIVGWMHVWVLWKWKFSEPSKKNMLILSSFVLAFPLIYIHANGFGNSFSSLAFLVSIVLMVEGKERKSLILSGLFPLIRPDAVIFSAVNNLFSFVKRRDSNRSIKLIEKMAFVLLPLASLGLYGVIFKTSYGHFIPTPILFKKVELLSALKYLRIESTSEYLIQLNLPILCGVFYALSIVWICFKKRNPDQTKHLEEIQSVLLYFLLSLPICLYYILSVQHQTLYALETRYWVSAYVLMAAAVALIVSSLDSRLKAEPRGAGGLLAVFVFMLFYLNVLAVIYYPKAFMEIDTEYRNRPYPAQSGEIAKRVIPPNYRIATTEMNGFGLSLEREVIDFFGYTNRVIAQSEICNRINNRIAPEYFMEIQPEIFYPWWFKKHQTFNYDTAEKALLFDHFMPDQWNVLGDMEKVIDAYDLFILKGEAADLVAFLVRKDKTEELRHYWTSLDYPLSRSRPFDKSSYLFHYQARWLIQKPCAESKFKLKSSR